MAVLFNTIRRVWYGQLMCDQPRDAMNEPHSCGGPGCAIIGSRAILTPDWPSGHKAGELLSRPARLLVAPIGPEPILL